VSVDLLSAVLGRTHEADGLKKASSLLGRRRERGAVQGAQTPGLEGHTVRGGPAVYEARVAKAGTGTGWGGRLDESGAVRPGGQHWPTGCVAGLQGMVIYP